MFKDKYLEDYKEYALELLKNVISYPSVLDEYKENSDAPFGKANKEALNYILSVGEKDGFEILNSDNYAGHIGFGSGEVFALLAHLDVVPVTKSEWVSDPFTLAKRDGKFYARGVMDDKGPLIATYIAMKMLKDEGFKPSKNVRLIMGCDEESGSRCLDHYYKHIGKPKIGFSPDAEFPLINGEKGMCSYDVMVSDNLIKRFTSGERYNMVPSYAEMELDKDYSKEFNKYLFDNKLTGKYEDGIYKVYGLAAHAMCPEKGINAAWLLFEFLNQYTDSKLAKFVSKYYVDDTKGKKLGYNDYDEEMKDLTSNFAVVRIEDHKGKFGVNCRVPKDEDFNLINECVAKATAEFGYTHKMLYTSERHFVPSNNPLVETLMNIYKEVSGDKYAKPFSIGGGTYARELECGVAFGPLFPGREDVCHIANEYMYEEDFDKLVEIYYKSIKELTK
ncbi:MAG: dipeptidase PepV [Acholeplasmatales bacterium]|nr:dipeptidase PepV [Acholeplasmatales bacterium]